MAMLAQIIYNSVVNNDADQRKSVSASITFLSCGHWCCAVFTTTMLLLSSLHNCVLLLLFFFSAGRQWCHSGCWSQLCDISQFAASNNNNTNNDNSNIVRLRVAGFPSIGLLFDIGQRLSRAAKSSWPQLITLLR